jgi:hypothetical protein
MECQQASHNNQYKPMNQYTMMGKTISRSRSMRILNEMADDESVRKTIKAIPRSQRNRRIRKFVSLAGKRGVSAAVLISLVDYLNQ